MRSRLLRANLVTGTIVTAMSLAQFNWQAVAATDWVEHNEVNEFHLPKAEEQNDSRSEQPPPTEQISDDRQPANRQNGGGVDEQTSSPDKSTQGSKRKSEYVPPDDAVIKNVTDDGGVENGPRTPLEARISTTRPGWSDGDGTGVDQRAQQLMMQAPMLATPKTVYADPKAFKAWLTATNPGVLENATKEQVVEIKGEWDDCAHALRTFGIPYTRVPAKKFSELNLDRVKIVVVNCEGHLPNEAILSLRRYVAMGGYLLTTDWALQNVVEKAFPRTVRWYEGCYTSDSSNRIVPAVVVGQDPDMIAGIPPVGHWQLVKKSQVAQIVDPSKVKVLARTRLMSEDPNGLGILAVVIEHGTGRIMHLVGHFDNSIEMASNSSLPDPAPGLALSLRQALAANFIAQALKHGEPAAPTGTQTSSEK